MMVCDHCSFRAQDDTLKVCPKCSRVLVYEPSVEEIAEATAKIRAGWSRAKQAKQLAYPKLPVEVTRAKQL